MGVVMTGLGSCSPGDPRANFLRRTKGELLKPTRVCTPVLLPLKGQGGTGIAEDLLRRDPIVSRLKETDNKLDKLEAVDEVRSISDTEPRDEVGVTVAEFRTVSEAEESDELTELVVTSESPEKLAPESRIPGEAEKKDDRDELDMPLKRAVCGVALGRV